MSTTDPLTILCLASHEKGNEFMQECKRQGCRVFLLTREKFKEYEWAWESIDEVFYMPTLVNVQHVINAVSYLSRNNRIDRVIALDDFDVERAAALREHMRLPGMGETAARYFRDKLTMREGARAGGIPEPEFTPTWPREALHQWMERVPPPWVLKPRSEAAATGIHKVHEQGEVWRLLEMLGDRQSYFLLEQYLPGTVCHVDSVIWQGEVLFAEAHCYARPPFDVTHAGGVFCTRTLPRESDEARELRALNARVLKALGMTRGVSHTEFIRAEQDGSYYFLETSSRVGGAHIAEMVEAATGLNLWREWARVEVAHARGDDYRLPDGWRAYAGLLISLSRQQYPDTSAYQEQEIVWRLNKPYHAGLIVSSGSPDRVKSLLDDYQRRFAEDFSTYAPPPETLVE
jgi:biotin carboxylase